jgi:hypothetical protein
MVDYSRLDDVLIELANRFTQANTFSLTPKQAGQIIGQLAMEVRTARDAAAARNAATPAQASDQR